MPLPAPKIDDRSYRDLVDETPDKYAITDGVESWFHRPTVWVWQGNTGRYTR